LNSTVQPTGSGGTRRRRTLRRCAGTVGMKSAVVPVASVMPLQPGAAMSAARTSSYSVGSLTAPTLAVAASFEATLQNALQSPSRAGSRVLDAAKVVASGG
jgi:hypothetical protein